MEKVSPEKVGERIRAVRGKQTQTEFANLLGVKKQNYISRYERGRIPSPDLLVRIAEVGRVTTDWLLTGKRGGTRGTALSQHSKAVKKVKPADVKPATKPAAKPKPKLKSNPKTSSKKSVKPKTSVKTEEKVMAKAIVKSKVTVKAKTKAVEKPAKPLRKKKAHATK